MPSLPALFDTLTHGVYVIGIAGDGRRNAFTAAWVMQVSFNPPMLALSVNPHHRSYSLLKRSGTFSVNVLPQGRLDLAMHFGQAADIDKLAGQRWRPLPTGAPRLDDAVAWFDCQVKGELTAGDHVVITGLVVGGGIGDNSLEAMNYRETGATDGSACLYPAEFPDA